MLWEIKMQYICRTDHSDIYLMILFNLNWYYISNSTIYFSSETTVIELTVPETRTKNVTWTKNRKLKKKLGDTLPLLSIYTSIVQ